MGKKVRMGNNLQCSGNQIPEMEIKTTPPICRVLTPPACFALPAETSLPTCMIFANFAVPEQGAGETFPRAGSGPGSGAEPASRAGGGHGRAPRPPRSHPAETFYFS